MKDKIRKRLSKGLSHRDSFGAVERLRLRLRAKE